MKPSQQWKSINENQFWKHLPKNYKQPSGKPLPAKQKSKAVNFYLTERQFNWLQTFRRNYRNFYGSDDSVVESIFVNMINKPIEQYLYSDIDNEAPRPEVTSEFTFVVSEAILKNLSKVTIFGNQAGAQRKLKTVIQNSKELHDNGWFQELTKRRTKNPTRKEVL